VIFVVPIPAIAGLKILFVTAVPEYVPPAGLPPVNDTGEEPEQTA
jgi:hypothetical protein